MFYGIQDLLATNLVNGGGGDIGGSIGSSVGGSSSASSLRQGACRLSFSSVLLIVVTLLIIKVNKTIFWLLHYKTESYIIISVTLHCSAKSSTKSTLHSDWLYSIHFRPRICTGTNAIWRAISSMTKRTRRRRKKVHRLKSLLEMHWNWNGQRLNGPNAPKVAAKMGLKFERLNALCWKMIKLTRKKSFPIRFVSILGWVLRLQFKAAALHIVLLGRHNHGFHVLKRNVLLRVQLFKQEMSSVLLKTRLWMTNIVKLCLGPDPHRLAIIEGAEAFGKWELGQRSESIWIAMSGSKSLLTQFQCNVSCGVGHQQRSVECVWKHTGLPAGDACKTRHVPNAIQQCQAVASCTSPASSPVSNLTGSSFCCIVGSNRISLQKWLWSQFPYKSLLWSMICVF